MVDHEEFARWMKQAEHTLESAKKDMVNGDFAWACLKAEQAAQFALKALVRGLGRPAFGHSVHRLVEQAERAGIGVPAKIADAARELERHHIPSRYPDAYPSGSPYEFYREQDAHLAIGHTEAVLRFAQEAWDRVGHP